MWLNVGIPVLVLAGVVAVRVVYYVFWRKHWDRRPRGREARREEEVVVIRETESHLRESGAKGAGGEQRSSNDVRR